MLPLTNGGEEQRGLLNMASIKVYTERDNELGVSVLHVDTPHIDYTTGGLVKEAILNELQLLDKIVVDLSMVEVVDTPGIAAIVNLLKEVKTSSTTKRIACSGVPNNVRRIMELLGVNRILEIYDHTDLAIASLATEMLSDDWDNT